MSRIDWASACTDCTRIKSSGGKPPFPTHYRFEWSCSLIGSSGYGLDEVWALSLRWCDYQIAKLDWSMVTLKQQRTRRRLVTIQRSSSDAWDRLIADDRPAVQDYGYQPAYQSYVEGLPLTRWFSGVFIRREESVDAAKVYTRRLESRAILDLHFVPPPQIDSAVAILRIAKLGVEFEVGEFLIGQKVPARFGIG